MKHTLIIFLVLICQTVVGQKSNVFFHLDKLTIKEKVIKDSTSYKRYETKAIEQFRLNGYTGIKFKDSVVKKRWDALLLFIREEVQEHHASNYNR